MKKSIRILSIILALSMLLGNLTVIGSAYAAYTGAAITDYDDVDKATFTTEQYASMALDELDRMLAKEQIVLTEDDIFVGTIDLRSANATFSSVVALVDSADQLLGMLGDGAALPEMVKELCIDKATTPYKRSTINDASGNCTDLQMLTALINFVSCDTTVTLVKKFVNGNLSLGMLDSIVAGILDIDVRELVMGLLYGIMDDEFDADEDENPYTSLDVLLQDLIHYALIGDTTDTGSAYVINEGDHEGLIWDFLKDLDYASVKEIYTATNVIETEMTAYELIEQILRLAYNYIAVPELNEVTRPWLREICGVTYDPEKMDPESDKYVEDYDGEIVNPEDVANNPYAQIFDYENMYVPEIRVPAEGDTITRNGVTMTVAEDATFISYFNDALCEFLNCVLKVDEGVEDSEGRTWTWITCEDTSDYNGTWFGTDGYLLTNIASAAKYVLGVTGDAFFADYIETYDYVEYMQMSDQEIWAFVLRNLLNASVDWMYIDDTNTTIADVGYAAVEQLAWQDLPQYTYTKPTGTPETPEYNNAIIEACLDILMDVAVFNINKSIDMVPAERAENQSPAVPTDSGLLEFEHDYEKLVLQIAIWGVCNYGAMLTGDGLALDAIELDKFGGEVGDLTINDVWEDIDLIVNSIFPISSTLSGSSVWLYGEIAERQNAEGGSDVVRSLIFDYLVNPLLELNATNIEKIMTKNTSGTFATGTVLKVLIDLVTNVINLIFPGTIASEYASLDAVLVNSELAGIAERLLKTFGAHFNDWAVVVLPVVCDLLGLTDAQEFAEMEINLPEIVSGATSFTVYNGCSGLNTGYTNEIGNFTQDQLYKYKVTRVETTTYVNGAATSNVSATGIAAGDDIDGGGFKNVTLSGTFTPGSIIEFTVYYNVLNEIGAEITSSPLAATKYAYVGQYTDGDDVRKTVVPAQAPFEAVEYAPAIYIGKGEGLGEAGDYTFNVKRVETEGAGDVTVSVTGISGVDWLQVNSDNTLTSQVTKNGNGTYAFAPFEAKNTYVRYEEVYETVKEVTEETFAAREVDWYVKNEYNTYSKVAANAAFDETKVYYTYTNNSENTNGPDGTRAITVADGVYNATITVNVNGTNFNLPVVIHLYSDYDLGSAYSNAVRANRQKSDYNQADTRFDGLWSNYKLALQNAGALVLAPKSNSNFESNKVTTNANYPNKYAELYDALADAIEALDELQISAGVAGLEAAIATYGGLSNSYYLADASQATYEDEVAGWNDVKYYATDDTTKYRQAYHFFSALDYVPHTYYTYRDAKDRAQDIINSQIVYPPVRPEAPEAGANVYEQTQYQEAMKLYNEAYAAYEIALANIAPASPVEVAYALHMVTFTGGRLISLTADKNKLDKVIELYGAEANTGYSASTWEAYETAVAFANSTMTNRQAKPSQVNVATGELVEAYKKLVEGLDYTALNNAIASAKLKIDEVEINADGTQSVYSEESWKELTDAYNEGVELVESDLGLSSSNEIRVAESVQRITDAIANLEAAASDPVWEFVTADTDLDGGWFYDDGGDCSFPHIQSGFEVEMLGEEPSFKALEGIGPYQNGDDALSHIIVGDENTEIEFVPREDDAGDRWLTTGSKILVKDKSGTVVETYYPVLVGDPSGDGEMGEADVILVSGYAITTPDYFWEWMPGMEGEPLWNYGYACDVDSNWEVNETDAVLLRRVVGYQGYVAQGNNASGTRGYLDY